VTPRVKVWASLCSSRLGETGSLGRDYQISPLFSCDSHSYQAKSNIQKNSTHPEHHINHKIVAQQQEQRKRGIQY